jgi:branched-chain amino acid transport system permease protein
VSVVLGILIDGFSYGMILFMISVGLSVTMGLMRVINLAHGGFALLGGAGAHWLTTKVGLGYVTSVALSIGAVMALSIVMERVLYRRIYKFTELQQVLATIGITFLMIASVNLLLGSTLLPIEAPDFFANPLDLGFRILPTHRLVVIIAGLIVAGGLYILLERTRFGIKLRAAVDNRNMAASLGINTVTIYALSFSLGAGLAAFGGILGAELLPIDAYYPLRYMVLFLVVVAVGGMGSVSGSFFAAIGLGIVDTAARYLVPEFGTIFFFVAMMIILTVRPNGLLGRG